MPSAHLFLEEPGQQEALGACYLHHRAVSGHGCVRYEVIEDDAEIRGSWPFIRGVGGDLRVVRQHTGVVEKFLPIDGGFGHVLEPRHKKLQHLSVVSCEQFSYWAHDTSRSRHVLYGVSARDDLPLMGAAGSRQTDRERFGTSEIGCVIFAAPDFLAATQQDAVRHEAGLHNPRTPNCLGHIALSSPISHTSTSRRIVSGMPIAVGKS